MRSQLKNQKIHKDFRFTYYKICMLNAFEKKWQSMTKKYKLFQMFRNNFLGKPANRTSVNKRFDTAEERCSRLEDV